MHRTILIYQYLKKISMDIQPQKIQTKPEPFDWSNYQRTYCTAIDLVAQCVGHHRKTMKPLKAIVLKPTSFDLLRAGLRVLMGKQGQHMDDMAPLYFDGIELKRGNAMQFDSIVCEYYPTYAN